MNLNEIFKSKNGGHRLVRAHRLVPFVQNPPCKKLLWWRSVRLSGFTLYQREEDGQLVNCHDGKAKVKAQHPADVG